MLIFSDPSVNLCPNSMMCTLPKPLHEYACTRSLTLPQFCHSGRHCFGKDPQCSPYSLQVMNPSFSHSLAWLCLLAPYPPRSEPSFWVTDRVWFPGSLPCSSLQLSPAIPVTGSHQRALAHEACRWWKAKYNKQATIKISGRPTGHRALGLALDHCIRLLRLL